MKKNKAMRMASVLLILVLLTTSVVSGTFAKYTTSASSTDTARVAKWGVTVTAASNSAFKTEYTTHDSAYSATITQSVKNGGADSAKLVAPGTSGTMTAVTLNGTPEVACKVNFEAQLTLDGWKNEAGAPYIPLKITVNGTTIDGAACSSLNDFITKVQNLIAGVTYSFGPNTDLNTESHAMNVSWEWPFSVNDVHDTYLGNQASEGKAATIELEVTTTVTQID